MRIHKLSNTPPYLTTLCVFVLGPSVFADEACRLDPTWTTTDHAVCKEFMKWQPKNSLWNHTLPELSNLLQEKDAVIRQCLQVALQSERQYQCQEDPGKRECQVKTTKVRGHYYQGGNESESDEIVVLSDVLTEQEALGLEVLDRCVRGTFPGDKRFYEAREFGNETAGSYGMYNEDGGNYCTFLNGLLQTYLPGVAAATYQAVQLAYQHSQWSKRGLPPPHQLGIHSAEFLQYRRNGRLSLHEDDESVFTISVALSRYDDYEGGYFTLATREALWKVPRRSAIVFFGESYHGITEIEKGERKVFVMEMWDQADAPVGSARPQKEDYYQSRKTAHVNVDAQATVYS